MKKAISHFLREQWLNILESVDGAMLVVGPGGTIEFMNESAAELMRQSASIAIGEAAIELLSGNAWVVDLLGTASDHAVHRDGALVHTQHATIPVRASATPLVQEDGTRIGTLLSLQNLTHQRELEARTREVKRLGELETLVAGLAHEIRNPLAGMRGAAQLLAGRPATDETVRECTSIMVEEIDRLDGLMAQLLELSAPPRFERVPVNVHQILDHVLSIEAARGITARIVRHFDPSLPPVRGDPDRLTQVLLNLVRNAIEATPAQASITLTTRIEASYRVSADGHHGRFLAVEVRDEGEGIPEIDLERIFSPFFTTKAGGTGLGLAISQRIVSEHGGALRARNATSGGAVFTVTLPVEPGTTHDE